MSFRVLNLGLLRAFKFRFSPHGRAVVADILCASAFKFKFARSAFWRIDQALKFRKIPMRRSALKFCEITAHGSQAGFKFRFAPPAREL